MVAKLDTLVLERQQKAYRAPALYTIVGSPYVIFTITGGPVWIKGIFLHSTLIQNAGSDIFMTCNGVAFDAGAVVINVAAGGFLVWPMAAHIPVMAVMTPMPATLALPHNLGMLASPTAADATISITIGTADLVNPISFFCVYYAMGYNARII